MKKTLQLLSFALWFVACSSADRGNPIGYVRTDSRVAITEERYAKQAMAAAEEEVPGTPPSAGSVDTSKYLQLPPENPFFSPKDLPLSTFSIDVDKASYAILRNRILMGDLANIPKENIRLEEMINYFQYDYAQPQGKEPFAVHTTYTEAPWNGQHRLLHIGLQGRNLNYDELVPCNLVFLVDVSGSMEVANKLPYIKQGLSLMLEKLSPNDRVSLVTYASGVQVVLPSTPVLNKVKILSALNQLKSGGGTAGEAGIKLAYDQAQANFMPQGNNRVIVCTDGDFNLGLNSLEDMKKLISEKRKSGIYLTLCGFGQGNFRDDLMKTLSKHGNGNYFYIDNEKEMQKVFSRELTANLFTLAADVKIQVEFNPQLVKAYRLVGYENRMLNTEDFEDDTKDAGELGAGHTVTAIYEVVLQGSDSKQSISPSDKKEKAQTSFGSGELAAVNLRYKKTHDGNSILIQNKVKTANFMDFFQCPPYARFAAAVAGFGLYLKDSPYKGNANPQNVLQWAEGNLGTDENGDKAEFLDLVREVMSNKAK